MPFTGFDAAAMAEKLKVWPFFHSRVYLKCNRDLSEGVMTPEMHFARHGCWEGRRFTSEIQLSADLSNIVRRIGAEPSEPASRPAHTLDIGVYVSSKSNFFMAEIARQLADGFRLLGLPVTLADEITPPFRRCRHSIIVAPHEFFLLGDGRRWARKDVIADCVMLSTEQPQTQWFATSLPYLFSSRGVLDLCWQSTEGFLEAGLNACFCMPGLPADWTFSRSFDSSVTSNHFVQSLPSAVLDYESASAVSLSSRPIDVTFMASESLLRDNFISRHVEALRDLRSVVIYRRIGNGPPSAYADTEQVTQVNDFVFRRTQVLLNIHRDSIGFFEIHRLGMQGIWNLCAVVTNPCLQHPYFNANEHYFEETIDRIPKLLRWLVSTPEGRQEAETMRWSALKRYAAVGNARRQSLRIVRFLEQSFRLVEDRV